MKKLFKSFLLLIITLLIASNISAIDNTSTLNSMIQPYIVEYNLRTQKNTGGKYHLLDEYVVNPSKLYDLLNNKYSVFVEKLEKLEEAEEAPIHFSLDLDSIRAMKSRYGIAFTSSKNFKEEFIDNGSEDGFILLTILEASLAFNHLNNYINQLQTINSVSDNIRNDIESLPLSDLNPLTIHNEQIRVGIAGKPTDKERKEQNELEYTLGHNISSYSISNARNYAVKYAVNPNSSYRNLQNGDCTNFISQIIHAGGVSFYDTNNIDSGWWYRFGNENYNKQFSRSWASASKFHSYWKNGRTMYFNDQASFFRAIEPGDIIGLLDEYNSPFHLAFVSYKTDYHFKVAQHTRNYYKWTYEDGNNWDTATKTVLFRFGPTKGSCVERGGLLICPESYYPPLEEK